MGADNILRSYGDTNVKEDVVLNAIEIITAEENQIFNMLGKTVALNTVHIYETDTLDTAASNAVGESEDYTAKALTTPAKLQNLVINEAYPFKVSRTQQKISHYSGTDELARQTSKALKNWGNSAEFDLVRSTLVSGVSGTAPKLAKRLTLFVKIHIIKAITSNLIIWKLFANNVNAPLKLNLVG